jgi:SnoaL-like domain
MFRTSMLLLLLAAGFRAHAEDIPLETCDRLPAVQVSVSGMKFLFLVDTAATSMLNLQSFAHGDERTVTITSWSGTVETKAQEITLADLAVGRYHFKYLRLPALDLSAIGRGCGRKIDGIFGIDLLSRLGATLDLKGHSPRLQVDSETEQARIAALHEQLVGCEQAFNRADEAGFAECLDPQVVIYTVAGDFYGREAAMEFYRNRYFRHDPPAQLTITSRAHHAIGDAIWVEYDLRILLGDKTIAARGIALCQKVEGKWRIVHMNHSSPPGDTIQAQGND